MPRRSVPDSLKSVTQSRFQRSHRITTRYFAPLISCISPTTRSTTLIVPLTSQASTRCLGPEFPNQGYPTLLEVHFEQFYSAASPQPAMSTARPSTRAAKAQAKQTRPSQPEPSRGKSKSPISKVFVDSNERPYKFYIKDLFPNWDEDARKQLEDGIKVRPCANRPTYGRMI